MKQNSFTGKKHGGTPSQKPIYYSKDKFRPSVKPSLQKMLLLVEFFFSGILKKCQYRYLIVKFLKTPL